MEKISIPPEVRSPSPEIDYKNRCQGCGEDMGKQNPRQLCQKTYCDQVDDISKIGTEWQCLECKITLTINRCPLCYEMRPE
tara:strand:- start:169 stop:411 length:243 start_codon:yes stop_codon:yes gene_type:complete